MTAPADDGIVRQGLRARMARLARSGWLRNVSFSTADHALLLVLWAVSTPVFIGSLGEARFGLWVLVNAVVGLGGAFSLGLGEATVRYVALHRASGRRDLAARVVETTLALYAAVGLGFGACIAFFAPSLAAAVEIDAADFPDAVTGLRLAGLALAVTAPLKVWEATINGFERFDVTARAGMVARTAIIGSNVAAALSGHGLAVLMGLTVLGLAGQTWALQRLARRLLPEIRPWQGPARAVTGDVLRFGAHGWVQILAGALASIADRFLVGALVGPAAAGVYAVCVQLAQQIHLLLVRGLAFLMPAASAAGEDGGAALGRAYGTASVLTLLVIGTLAAPLYALAPQVLGVWIGPDFAMQGTATLRLLTVYFAVWGAGVAGFYLLNGAGLPGWNTALGLLHGLILIGAAVPLLSALGLPGVGWARLAAVPMALIGYVALHSRVTPGTWPTSVLLLGGLAAPLALGAFAASWAEAAVPARLLPLAAASAAIGLGGAISVLPAVMLIRRGQR